VKYVTRTIETVIRKAIRTFPAIVLTGPRQSGKTTLLRHGWGKTHRFLSLENTEVRNRALSDPVGFLRAAPPPLILDEIQYCPELLSYVKTAIDDDRRPGRWLISGSQVLAMMGHVSQSLAGRTAVLSLLPFSVGEAVGEPAGGRSMDDILKALFSGNPSASFMRMPKRMSLPDWIIRGGFPEPRTKRALDSSLWMAAYIQTYLERDVRSLIQVGDLNSFDRFLRLCAARVAQILNLSDLARDAGISVPTANKWISILEASYAVFLLQPCYRNMGKRLIKAPKLYFYESSLPAFLLGVKNAESLESGPMRGPLFENAVVSAWRKAFLHRGEMPSMYYLRTRDGLEIDILIERNGGLYPMEIKSTSTVMPAHAASVKRWLAATGGKPGRGVIIADVTEPVPVVPDVRAVPWSVV